MDRIGAFLVLLAASCSTTILSTESFDFVAPKRQSVDDIGRVGKALCEVAEKMDCEDAVRFCRTLEENVHVWEFVSLSLINRPRAKVVPYFIETVQNRDPRIRFACYRACLKANWDDLVLYAENDKDNAYVVLLPNHPDDVFTLGVAARKYLAKFKSPSYWPYPEPPLPLGN